MDGSFQFFLEDPVTPDHVVVIIVLYRDHADEFLILQQVSMVSRFTGRQCRRVGEVTRTGLACESVIDLGQIRMFTEKWKLVSVEAPQFKLFHSGSVV